MNNLLAYKSEVNDMLLHKSSWKVIDQDGEMVCINFPHLKSKASVKNARLITNQIKNVDLIGGSLYELVQWYRFACKMWKDHIIKFPDHSVALTYAYGTQAGQRSAYTHMQLITYEGSDYHHYVDLSLNNVDLIDENGQVKLYMKSTPVITGNEFLIVITVESRGKDRAMLWENSDRLGLDESLLTFDNIDQLASYCQAVSHFILHHLNESGKSYNMFFYESKGKMIVRILPRPIIDPLTFGYGYLDENKQRHQLLEKMKSLYFRKTLT
ncbi:DUF4931 domain-containing protein [Terrilactibacillus sp. BCM23-1]|uniref:DUF4931 domain-containing protein n=1 Tax=Terrilactibacillus tamarindi TaxID=2599694 RepID=A0A6N8CRB4_9BACI|nr:DUF4931 domain-containing protein [Terrilactibacillus tamarindi]MTT30506.1 DUF4931 domain-containing protein [Terrilactibacillus tamarindi]